MAFNGITIACLRHEIEEKILGGRISRIAQTDKDEIILTIKPEMQRGGGQVRLLLCADASLPLCCFIAENRPSPVQAPAFCMLLRKYLQGGKITSVVQPGLERVIRIEVEHLDEMGDLCRHTLVLELMGKYSNLIFIDQNGVIVDSIRRVSAVMSSVREVLPGRPYFLPETQDKRDALSETGAGFISLLNTSPLPVSSLLPKSYTGFSSVTGFELCARAGIDPDRQASALSHDEKYALQGAFASLVSDIRNAHFSPSVYSRVKEDSRPVPKEYSAFRLVSYRDLVLTEYDSMSSLLDAYYAEKSRDTRIRQKTTNLRHTVQVLLERDIHKYDLQMKQLKDTEKRDKYRIYGELLHAYGYSVPEGASCAVLDNYYTGEKTSVPLDKTKTAAQNAQKYFDKYNKMKRTAEALSELTEETKAEIDQLQNIEMSLSLSADESDIAQIREELEKSGLIHRSAGNENAHGAKKPRFPKSAPFHFISSSGYDIYVGKNNLQNDEITFHVANGGDLWFHAKKIPGSHVVLRSAPAKMEDIPDKDFEEAAALAAYYSSGRSQSKVEIDYLYRRDVKKPGGSRPGFVVYYTNYSMMGVPDISGIRRAD
jgi:predicted ribosome quality control (RQC) complex YloA/Tae2 family protein